MHPGVCAAEEGLKLPSNTDPSTAQAAFQAHGPAVPRSLTGRNTGPVAPTTPLATWLLSLQHRDSQGDSDLN